MSDDEIAKLTTTTEFYVGLLLAVSSSRKFRVFRVFRDDSSTKFRLLLFTLR